MAKITSLILSTALLLWTWNMFHQKDEMGIEVHAALQSRLQIVIEETIKAKKPQIQNLKFLKMYSEKIEDNKVQAHFSYEFEDPTDSVKQKLSGRAILSPTLSEDPGIKKWIIQKIKMGTETVEFNEGISITADGKIESEDVTPLVVPTENK